VICISGVGAR